MRVPPGANWELQAETRGESRGSAASAEEGLFLYGLGNGETFKS